MDAKPTFNKPVNQQSKNFENNFNKTMDRHHVDLKEEEMIFEKEHIKKHKLFNLKRMETLVFSDPILSAKYNALEKKADLMMGWHQNENIMSYIFNRYVFPDAKNFQKYKNTPIPTKEIKGRGESAINQMKRDGEERMEKWKEVNKNVEETTGAASSGSFAPPLSFKQMDETTTSSSSGAYSGPAAWSKSGQPMRKPIWPMGTIIGESNYLTDPIGFEKYVNIINEQTEDEYMVDNTSAFNSNTIKNWDSDDKKTEMETLDNGTMDEPNLSTMEENYQGYYDNFEQADAEAQRISKEEGVTQHVNQIRDNTFEVSDWYDNEQTVSSYTKGIKLMEGVINEKATSKAQQKFMGMVHAVQKGELSPKKVGASVAKAAKTMKKGDVKDFASTKHEDLPEKVNEEGSMIDSNPTSMAFKAENTTMPVGLQNVGLKENKNNENMDNIFEELQNELDAYSIHHNKLVKMVEERKPSAIVLRDRVGSENEKNFKKDLNHSGTKEIINIEKELQWKDQQTDVSKNPQKLNNDIENKELKVTKGEAFDNVGNSDNDKGNEIPKRNFNKDEQDEIDLYRNGQHSLKYDNETGKRFQDRMKADMGEKFYDMGQKQLKNREHMSMYNKNAQPTYKEDKPTNIEESTITGKYVDILGKRRLIDFKLNESLNIKDKNIEDLFEIDFSGMGNVYSNKGDINENIIGVISEHKFYTDGKRVVGIVVEKQNLNEGISNEKPIVNEGFEKMQHLLGYKPKDYINTKNNRRF